MIFCKECGKEITDKPNNIFCNRKCAAIYNNKKRIKKYYCKVCGKIINKPRNRKNVICFSCFQIEKKSLSIEKFNNHKKLSSKTIRKIIIEERGYRCEKCGLESWLNKVIPLDIHHIDGNYNNNNRSNIILLCKNCHALTENYGSKNNGKGRPYKFHR